MIRHNQRRIKLAEVMDLPSQPAQRRVCGQEVLRRDPSDRKHHAGPQQLNLTHQKGETGGYLLGSRVAVARRSALQHVCDIHVVGTVKPNSAKHGIQQMPSASDERLSSPILFSPGGLPYD